ncbi:MAG: PilN domain-containing protein [Dissulfurimicrobium sp.]|uniref:PilN domain-containing protein n=1 Tax=Dissulfurimicrobium sp. TaxID=2022436 RepID=UPI00404B0AC2
MTFCTEIIGIYLDETHPQVSRLKLGRRGWKSSEVPLWPVGEQSSFYEQLRAFLQAIRPSRRRKICLAIPQKYYFLRELSFPQLEPVEAMESVRLGIELHAHIEKAEIYSDQFAFKRKGKTIVILSYIKRSVLDPIFRIFSETGHMRSLGPISPAFVGLDILLRRGKGVLPCVVIGRQSSSWFVSMHGDTAWEGAHPVPVNNERDDDVAGDMAKSLSDLSGYVPAEFARLLTAPAYALDHAGLCLDPMPEDPCKALIGISRLCEGETGLTWGLCAAALGLSLYPALSFQDAPRRLPFVLRMRPYQMITGAIALTMVLATGIMGFKLYVRSAELKAKDIEFARLYQELKPLVETRNKINAIRNEIALITSFKNEFPRPVEVLRLLTVNTPQDTWIQNFNMKDDKLRITAEGNSASQVTAEWRKLPFCAELKFTSPVMKDNNQKERFSVEITLANQKR